MAVDLHGALQAVAALVYPPQCPGCAEPTVPGGTPFCTACHETLVRMEEVPHCPRCMDAAGPAECRRCTTSPPPFDGVFAGLLYGGAVKDGIQRLKFGDAAWAARPLWQAAHPDPAAWKGRVDVVIPVPLHPARHRERGYDQAARLAGEAARSSGLPMVRALARTRSTRAVAALSADEREQEVQGAFAVVDLGAVRGMRVGLVDDVVTTGATVRAISRVLREAGAAAVVILALARGGHGADG